jgi:sugar lactone lactonase YvrE
MPLRLSPICPVALLLACRPPGSTPEDTDDTVVIESDAPEPFDCNTASTTDLPSRLVPDARASHGLVFSDDGTLYGNADGVLYALDTEGNQTILATGLGTLHQLDLLPDGDLVAASATLNAVLRITRDGSVTPLVTIPNLYGLRVGPDAQIYVADQRDILRVDPDSGAIENLTGSPNDFFPKVFDWSVDGKTLFVGTVSSSGKVLTIPLDDTLTPTDRPRTFARAVGTAWHDALTVDACGNLYVAETFSRALYRVTPGGEVTTLLQSETAYPHGLGWAPAGHGWNPRALYLAQPYDGSVVTELGVDVPSKAWPGEVVGVAAPADTGF